MKAMTMRVYRYAGEYLLTMRGERSMLIEATRAWALDHGAVLDWDDVLGVGTLYGLEDVYCMLTDE